MTEGLFTSPSKMAHDRLPIPPPANQGFIEAANLQIEKHESVPGFAIFCRLPYGWSTRCHSGYCFINNIFYGWPLRFRSKSETIVKFKANTLFHIEPSTGLIHNCFFVFLAILIIVIFFFLVYTLYSSCQYLRSFKNSF